MNLSYETALKLKEAGYPQLNKGVAGLIKDPECTESFSMHQDANGNYQTDKDPLEVLSHYAYAPTLEEIIDAMQGRHKRVDGLINDAQVCLRKSIGRDGYIYIAWLDGDWESVEYEQKYFFVDKDPRTAMANLWLALNSK